MSDASVEASEKYIAAESLLMKKGLFKKPDPEAAAALFVKAANLFKIAKNYDRAGEAFHKASIAFQQIKDQSSTTTNLNNAINCYNLSDPSKSTALLEELIKASAAAGKFLQAGKACVQQAEKLEEAMNYVEARKVYERAVELLQAENNADSDLRAAQQKVAEILAMREKEYLKAAKLYEEIGTKCLKIKLLQFHSRNFFFLAFLCVMLLDDEIALEDCNNKYNQLDPNLEGSAEGDFMKETIEAIQQKSGDKYITAYAKLNQRANLRGNNLVKTLIGEGQGMFKEEQDEQDAFGGEEQPAQNNAEDDDGML
ncbi:Alpha-SNAP [Hexamita inflata]|uniref:Alpha-SNAP n=1 Tax=Hexamita inflata TaxID=28002 RepID=A0AA86QTK5_9EUKA|nr:Alpha-SNAP [Hexamita inflata]